MCVDLHLVLLSNCIDPSSFYAKKKSPVVQVELRDGDTSRSSFWIFVFSLAATTYTKLLWSLCESDRASN